MSGPSRRPTSTWRLPQNIPPWLTAVLTVAGILLTINALPMLASAITPDRIAAPAAFSMADPAGGPDGAPLTDASADEMTATERAAKAAAPKAQASKEQAPANTSADGAGRPAAAGTLDAAARAAKDPLPGTGGRTLPQLAIAVGLLCGGLGLLVMVGFSGARPWPGRYVRRIG